MKLDKDKVWTYVIIFVMIVTLLLSSILVNAQTKKDTVLYNQFRDYYEWLQKRHKETVTEMEDTEKYQMIYFDKAIVDRKNHKIYVYSSYDLVFQEELGVNWQIVIPHKKNKSKLRKKINRK